MSIPIRFKGAGDRLELHVSRAFYEELMRADPDEAARAEGGQSSGAGRSSPLTTLLPLDSHGNPSPANLETLPLMRRMNF